MSEEQTRFFLRFGDRPWEECTPEEFRSAERASGFNRPTGGFGSGLISGTQMHRQAYFNWSEGARLLTPLPLLKTDCFDFQSLGAFIDYEGRDESEEQWQRDAMTTEWHIKRAKKSLSMIKNGTLPLYDYDRGNTSLENLSANLRAAVNVMRLNIQQRVRYREIKQRYGIR